MKAQELHRLIQKALQESQEIEQDKCLARLSFMVYEENITREWSGELPDPLDRRDSYGAPYGGKEITQKVNFDIEDFEAITEISKVEVQSGKCVLTLDSSWNFKTQFKTLGELMMELEQIPQESEVEIKLNGKTLNIGIDDAEVIARNVYVPGGSFSSQLLLKSYDEVENPDEDIITQFMEVNEEMMADLALQAYEEAREAYYDLKDDAEQEEW